MNCGVHRAEATEEWSITEHRLNATCLYGFHNCLGSQLLDIESGRDTTHLKRKVGIAPTDYWNIKALGEGFDPSAVFWMFAIDLDSIELGIALSECAVPKRVSNDRDTVVVVGEVDRLRW
jgi:hypothetical protein